MAICDDVFNFLSKPIFEIGYELVEVEYKKKQNGMNMTLFIDSSSGINLEDCEKVHKLSDKLLDELDPTKGSPYILNVSSLGLDRPFKTNRDFERALETEVDVFLYAKLDGKKYFEGKLIGFDENSITLVINNIEQKIERSKISKITKHIVF